MMVMLTMKMKTILSIKIKFSTIKIQFIVNQFTFKIIIQILVTQNYMTVNLYINQIQNQKFQKKLKEDLDKKIECKFKLKATKKIQRTKKAKYNL